MACMRRARCGALLGRTRREGLLQCNEAAAGHCMEAQQLDLARGRGLCWPLLRVCASRLTLPEPLATLQDKQHSTPPPKHTYGPGQSWR